MAKVLFAIIPEGMEGDPVPVKSVPHWREGEDGPLPRTGDTVALDGHEGGLAVVSVFHDFREGHDGADIVVGLMDSRRFMKRVQAGGGAPV